MAGHSKWANIQHRKGAQDQRRGKVFNKLIREISVASRIGGPDQGSNARLRLAVDKARAASHGPPSEGGAPSGVRLPSIKVGETPSLMTDTGAKKVEFKVVIRSGRAVLKAVPDPHRFGVAEFGDDGRVIGFEEKPADPKSNRIPIGVYLFRPSVFDVLGELRPSARGEFEITDVLNHYVREGSLIAHDFAGDWMDAGTVESLLDANTFAAGFAAEHPMETGRSIAEVEAEPVDPGSVRP